MPESIIARAYGLEFVMIAIAYTSSIDYTFSMLTEAG
jgi:hypothetical protein